MSRSYQIWILPIVALGGACGPPPPPCDGTWGPIVDPDAAVHVREDGDDAGLGTHDDPLATMAAAVDATRTGPVSRIVLGLGEFVAALELEPSPPAGGTDDGLVIEGCGVGQSVLTPLDAADPILRATAATGVEVRDLSLRGGERPLWVWSGADLTAKRVNIDDALVSGFVVDGPYTIVTLEDVQVSRSAPVAGAGGYGGSISGSTVTWTGGGVTGATSAALIIDGSTAQLEASGLELADTLADAAGSYGRGLQVQNYAAATVRDSTFAGNQDAGLFALLAADLTVEGSTFLDTRASADGGDALVVTGVDADGRQLDPATFQATLSDNTIDAADRAGILLERVTATVDANTVTGTAPDTERVAQEGAVVSGSDVVVELDDPLPLDRDDLDGTLP